MKIPSGRKGQTTVEYALTALVVLVFFTTMYKFFSFYVPKQFKNAAGVIMRVYKQTPW